MVNVVILAKNEANNLAELLPTLNFADRVVVIDDESNDGTEKVCQNYGVERVVWPLTADFARSRNYALSIIKNGWVLFLDADERLSAAAIQDIIKVTKNKPNGGYLIRRKDVFYGKELNWGETKDVWLLRLAGAESGRWSGRVHEVWQVKPTQKLSGEIYHYSHQSIAQLFASVKMYARIRAKELAAQKKYWRLDEQLFFPVVKFLYLLIVKMGILDGWRGFIMSLAMAYHSCLVRWYLWDLPWLKRNFKLVVWRRLMMVPILLLPFGQLLRGQVWGVTIYGHEIFMGLGVITSIGLVNFKPWLKQNRQWRAILAFSLVLGLSLAVSVARGMPLSGGLYWGRWLLYMAYLLLLGWGASHGLRVAFAGLLNYMAIGLMGFGWIQYLIWPDTRKLALLGWDDHYFRMIGSLFDPNFLGLLLVLMIIWTSMEAKNRFSKVLTIMAIASLPATFSRGSWLTLMVVFAAYLLLSRKWRRIKSILLVGLTIIAVLWILPKPGGESVNIARWGSIVARADNLRQGISVFADNPVLGIGFNQHGNFYQQQGKLGVEYHPQSPDNSLVYVMETAGTLGLVTFLYLLLVWWQTYPALVVKLSLVAIMVHSMINNSFFYPFILLWWGVLLANQEEKKFTEKNLP